MKKCGLAATAEATGAGKWGAGQVGNHAEMMWGGVEIVKQEC